MTKPKGRTKKPIPNPGSNDAIDQSCTCPTLDNNHGVGLGNGNFWISETCPLHAGTKPTGKKSKKVQAKIEEIKRRLKRETIVYTKGNIST